VHVFVTRTQFGDFFRKNAKIIFGYTFLTSDELQSYRTQSVDIIINEGGTQLSSQ
jgi:hypothetical protein